jgi:hypothetical protein
MDHQEKLLELEYRGPVHKPPARRLAGWMVASASFGVLPAFVMAFLGWRLRADRFASLEYYLLIGGLTGLILASVAYFVLLVCCTWRVLHGRSLWRKRILVVARLFGFLWLVVMGLDVTSLFAEFLTFGLRHGVDILVWVGVGVYCAVTVQVNWWMIKACEGYVDSGVR